MSSVSDSSSLRGQVVEYETYIDQQIAKTSFYVKMVDVFSGLVLLGVTVAASLLLLVIVDHWVVGLNHWARLASLAIVSLLAIGVFVTRVAPPLIRSINPTYAAQTLERAFPGLNNGLVNFLFFRERPDTVRRGIYKGMEKQAAASLADVPIDSAVDRGELIRWGYGLVFLAAVWCAYILFSPKNPFQTVSRVLTPWREISRPSQVDIVAVSPGDVEIFRGQSVEVVAEIRNLKDGQVPHIEFSTDDGQVVAQQIPLAISDGPKRYRAVLATGDDGIHQDLAYRVVAGDAVSPMYQVTASLAPHIVVERLQYDFPSYTQRPGEMVEGEGDINAIEGTTVRIFGKANQPIRSGYIELIQQLPPNADNDATPTIKTAPLTVRGAEAEFRFRLRLDSDRVRSVYSSYRLHFVNEQQVPSQNPVTHSMEVIPDLRPVVKILSPAQRTVQLPENGRQQIDLRALDPDYELTSLQLAIRTRTEELVRKDLISEARSGQVVASFDFVPRKYGLKSGDVVQYEGVAKDNRHAPLTGQLEPNQTISSKQYFRITPTDPLAERPPQPAGKAKQPDDPQQDEESQSEEQSTNGGRQSKSGRSASGPEQQPSDDGETPSSGGERQEQEGDPQESQAGEQGSETGLQQDGTSSGEKEQRELDSGETGDGDGQGDGSSRPGGDQPLENDTSDQSRNDRGDNHEAAGEGGSQTGDQDSNARGARPDEPLENDGTRDGEVVERIQEYLREQDQLDSESNPDTGSEGSESADDTGQQQNSRPDDGTADGTLNDNSEPTETVSPDEATVSEEENANGDESGGSSSGETAEDPTRSSQDAEQRDRPSATPATDEQSGSTTPQKQVTPDQETASGADDPQQGTGNDSDTGRASDQPGQPGQTGDRHTDAANQADQPGPSPSDGARRPEGAPADPSQQSSKTDAQQQPEQATGDQNAQQERSPNSDDQAKEGRKSQQEASRSGDEGGTGDGDSHAEGSPSGASQGADSSSATGTESNASPPKSDASSSAEKGESESSVKATKGNPAAKGSLAGQESAGGAGEDLGGEQGDDANLEHAKQATDMVLEYLRDQQQSTNPELLEKLGWTPEDVNKFLKRWDQLKQNAQADAGKQELNDALRSMGLRPREGAVRQDLQTKDQLRGNRESGRRVKPPSDVVDQYRAFLRSLQQTER